MTNTGVYVNHSKSKKISEITRLSDITSYQDTSFIPIAHYDTKTHTYINATVNLKNLTTYSISYSCAYSLYLFGESLKYADEVGAYVFNAGYSYTTERYYELLELINNLSKEQLDALAELSRLTQEWNSFSYIKNATDFENASYIVNSDPVLKSLVSYNFAYTMGALGWQVLNGKI